MAPRLPAGWSILCLTRHSITPDPSCAFASSPHFLSIRLEQALEAGEVFLQTAQFL